MNTKALLVPLMCLTLPAQPGRTDEPRYANDGRLMRPDNYREWIYLSSGLGMTYGVVESTATPAPQRFDNVFVTPQAYKAFMQTGAWPDKTMFALEVRNSATKGSINKGGHYQEGVTALEIHLKDQSPVSHQVGIFWIRRLRSDRQALSGKLLLPDLPRKERSRRRDVRAVLSDTDSRG